MLTINAIGIQRRKRWIWAGGGLDWCLALQESYREDSQGSKAPGPRTKQERPRSWLGGKVESSHRGCGKAGNGISTWCVKRE